MIRIMLICLMAVLSSGCSDNDDARSGEHVFNTQTRALDKARAVEQTLEGSAVRQRQAIEEQGR